MNFFAFDIKKILLITFALILPLLSINMERNPEKTQWYSQPFSYVAGAIQATYSQFHGGVRDTTSVYLNLIDIRRENEELKKENSLLKTELAIKEELKSENRRLSELLDFKHRSKMELLASRVISRDLFVDHHTVQINRGTRDGLRAGMAVISTSGVVGYVFRPTTKSSQVLLMTDRYAVVDAIVQRSRARGVIEGKTPRAAQLLYVEKAADVQSGDMIVTSGLDNIFPKGFPIGIVDEVGRTPGAVSLRVSVRPMVDPNKIEEVFVVLDAAYEDFEIEPQGLQISAEAE